VLGKCALDSAAEVVNGKKSAMKMGNVKICREYSAWNNPSGDTELYYHIICRYVTPQCVEIKNVSSV
jgi:hypothetical protein